MAANVIVSTGTLPDGPGYAQHENDPFYAANTALWWKFTYKSASTTTIYAYYSSDLITWTAPTNPTFTLAHANSRGVNLGTAYANLGSTDVVHLALYNPGFLSSHLRATLSGTTITWGTEVAFSTTSSLSAETLLSNSTCVASDGHAWDRDEASGNLVVLKSTNADSGTSWTTGFNAQTQIVGAGDYIRTGILIPLSSGGKVLAVSDDGFNPNAPKNHDYSLWNGTAWAANTILFAADVVIQSNDWGICKVSDTDVHIVRYEGSGVFTHYRWNGTTFSAAQSITNQNCKAGAGVAMTTDGTSVWLFIVDTDTPNTIRSCPWTAGAWGSWTAFETSTQVRNYLTVNYSAAKATIAVCWSQTNGSNFDLVIEGMRLDPFPLAYTQAQRMCMAI